MISRNIIKINILNVHDRGSHHYTFNGIFDKDTKEYL